MRRWAFGIALLWGTLGWAGAASCSACDAATSGMSGKAVLQSDPRSLFVRVQTCIAERGCVSKDELEDPAWFERVLSGFVRGYVEGLGEWPRLERDCALLAFLDGALCVDAMVRYHIETELVGVLRAEGCGTQNDWDAVGRVILGCLAREDVWVARFGEAILPLYRLNARFACQHPA